MHEEPLPPEVEDELSRAEQRLVAGDAGEAIRLARHSLLARPSSRAFAIVARGFCAQGDLGNARAQLAHLSTADRSRVTRACAAAGIPLE